MKRSPFDSLFGNDATDVEVVDEAPLVPEIPFKIPMKIVERVMNNRCEGLELSILVSIYCFYMNYASCSSVQLLQWKKLRRNYSHYHCLEELHIGINC